METDDDRLEMDAEDRPNAPRSFSAFDILCVDEFPFLFADSSSALPCLLLVSRHHENTPERDCKTHKRKTSL